MYVNVKSLISKNQIDLNNDALKMKSDPSECLAIPPSQYYEPISSEDKTLAFESRFESGNLNLAVKVSDNEYNLVL